MEVDEVTEKIIGCAIEVHKELGCGFLENVISVCIGKRNGYSWAFPLKKNMKCRLSIRD